MRILIVEDNKTNQLLLHSFLWKYGECRVAMNGKDAVAAFRAAQKSGQRYDLICMDIMMPEMDGQTAIQEIGALEGAEESSAAQSVKIIMTTAANDMENVVKSFNSSAAPTCSNRSIRASCLRTCATFSSFRVI
jgi:two-component system chemotaxis response regulator CheY